MISPHRIKTTTNDICCLLVLENKNLVVCSKGTIEIINPQTGEIKETISTNEKSVWCIMEHESNYLIYSLYDKNIYIWNLLEHKHFYTFEDAHEKIVMKLISLTKEYICSCSDDITIKIWDIKNKKIVSTLSGGHLDCIYSILSLKDTNFIVSMSTDSKVIIWDWKKKQSQLTYYVDPYWADTSLIEFNNFIILGGYDRIYLIDTNSISKNVDSPIKELIINQENPSIQVNSICKLSDESILIFYDNSVFLSDTTSINKLDIDRKEVKMEKIVVLNENKFFYNDTKKLYEAKIMSTDNN